MRVEEVITGKCLLDMREDRGNLGGEEMEVMLVGFQMSNAFRERLVRVSKDRWYHGKKADGWAYGGWRLGEEMSTQQDFCKIFGKAQDGNGYIGTEGIKRLVTGGTVSGGWVRQEGFTVSGRASQPADTLDAALSLVDRMSFGEHTQN